MKIKAIDISYAQPAVDFNKVKKSGIKAVIIRNGYLNKTDTHFERHIRGAIEAGLDIGTYTYIMAKDTAQAKTEALQTIERLKPYKGYINYPVFCDMEDERYLNGAFGKVFDKRLCTDIIKTFCDTIKENGYYAALYINPAWLENFTHKKELLGKYDIWLAAWTDSPNKPTKYDYGQKMWQWGAGAVNGIKDDVDSNLVYVDYPAIIRESGLNYIGPEITSRKKVKEVYKSYGRAAIRRSWSKDSDNIVGRCEKGKLYPIDATITVNGDKWLRHAGSANVSMYKDGLILFKKTGNYKIFKTITKINVRSSPKFSNNILGVLNTDAIVYVTGDTNNGWTPCVYEGQEAYVSAAYIKEAQ